MDRPLKIIFLGHEYLLKANREFLKEFPSNKYKVFVIVPAKFPLKPFGGEKKLTKTLKENNYYVIPVKWWIFKHTQLQIISPSFYKLIKKIKPDVIFVAEEPYSLQSFEVSIFTGKKYKTFFYSAQNIYKKFIFPVNFFEKYVFKMASGIFAKSQTAMKILKQKKQNLKVFYLPFGIDENNFKKIEKDEKIFKKLGLRKPLIGFVGRLSKEKGIFILYEAFKKVYNKLKKGMLIFIGEGPLRKELTRKIKKEKMENVVKITGYIPHEEVIKYIALLDILALPSITLTGWKEQFGRVLIEAMSCGVPVIGSDSGEIPEVIGDAGLIFKEGQIEELKNCILKILENQDLKRSLIEKGIKRVKENFGFKKFVERFAKGLKESGVKI